MAEGINKDNSSTRRKLSQTTSIPPTFGNYLCNLDNPQNSTGENFILIWLDTFLDICSSEFANFIDDFQKLVHLILPFNNPDRCIDFIMDTKNEKIFFIVSGRLGYEIVPLIQNCEQIDSIYVYCDDKTKHDKWANKIQKVKGVFLDLRSIFDAFRRDIRQCEDDLLPFHILSSDYRTNWKLNQLDQLFIYTQLLKDILIEMDYKSNIQKDFVEKCYVQYLNNVHQMKLINNFKNEYRSTSSISWYMKECFISSMLNKALRIQDINKIYEMGFFIRDVHKTIKELQSTCNMQQRFTVYRGQGITESYFHRLLENNNGFISFNNFFIATTDQVLSRMYANFARDNHGLIGVLFEIEIDRSKSICTRLDKSNYDSDLENPILFSIQNIFRIQSINQTNNEIWQIQLKLTTNENELVRQFKNFVRDEIEQRSPLEQFRIIATKLQHLNI